MFFLEDAGINTESTETVDSRSTSQPQESKATVVQSDSDVLQQLVTEAVKKVLANQDGTNTDKLSCQNVVSQVVEGLKPSLTAGTSSSLDIVTTGTIENRTDVTTPINKPIPCVYNPTPIAELKKRHIPIVSYMPTRESRVAVKRKCSPDGFKSWLSISCESTEVQTTEIKYKPTTIINSEVRDSNQGYIPTYKSDTLSSNSYEEGSSNEYLLKLKEAYYPKCKKRREEYVPKNVKAPLKTVENLKESTLTRFQSGFDITDELSANVKNVSNVQPSEESIRSCADVEPKFSDEDDGIDENDNDDDGIVQDYDCNASKSNDEHVTQNTSYRHVQRGDSVNGIACTTTEHPSKVSLNDALFEEIRNEKILRDNDVLMHGSATAKEVAKILPSERGKTVRVETDVSVSVDKNAKEYKNRDKIGGKDEKSEDSSDKRQKEKIVSIGKSGSTCHGKGKHKSDSRRESKNWKSSKRHDRDKSRCKEQGKHWDKERSRERSESSSGYRSKREKKDHRESEKHREQRSKNSSEFSRKHEKTKKGKNVDERKRSKLSDKSNDKANEELRVHVKDSEKKGNPTYRSARSSDSIRLNFDDDSESEKDDSPGNFIDDEVVLSASDSDHDVQEECLKIFQVRILRRLHLER